MSKSFKKWRCFVPGCKNTSANDDIEFFPLPTNSEEKEAFKKIIEAKTGYLINKNSFDMVHNRICSAHFEAKDIHIKDTVKYRKRSALPSKFVYKKIDMEKIAKNCRLCFNKDGVEQLVLNQKLPKSNVTIEAALLSVLNIDLSWNISLPKTICCRCYKLVTVCYLLKREIQKSDALFQKHYQEALRSQHELIQPPDEYNNIDLNTINDDQEMLLISEGEEELEIESESEYEENNLSNDSDETDKEDVEMQILAAIEDELMEPTNQDPPQNIPPPLDIDEMLIKALELKTLDVKLYEKWPDELEKEKKLEDYRESHTCKNCKFVSSNIKQIKRHVDQATERGEDCAKFYEPKNKCYICNKLFIIEYSLLEHLTNQHQDHPTDCPHCKRSRLKNAHSYNRHLHEHFTSPKFTCHLCGKAFHRSASIAIHTKKVHNNKNDWFYCDHCDFKSNEKYALSTHIKLVHIQSKDHQCEICAKTFTMAILLEIHTFKVHKTSALGCYKCHRCDYCLLYRRQMLKHVYTCDGSDDNPQKIVRIKASELDPKCKIKEFSFAEPNRD